jgi:hypothetical protein
MYASFPGAMEYSHARQEHPRALVKGRISRASVLHARRLNVSSFLWAQNRADRPYSVFQITWDEKICHAMLLCKVNHCGRWYLQVVSLHVVTVLQQYLMASRGECRLTNGFTH